ncbi:MAG: hypothetical protein HQK77_22330 [Desulfobacterales bacterium]|nr:hypothetical protein [Desulfobacterales bacterium]
MKILSFDVGIEQILYADNLEGVRLPDKTDGLPRSEEHLDRHLDSVLQTPTIEHDLLNSLKPDIKDKTLLNPVSYHAVMESVQQDLMALTSDQNTDSNINEVLSFFKGERELINLLNTYRGLLLKA